MGKLSEGMPQELGRHPSLDDNILGEHYHRRGIGTMEHDMIERLDELVCIAVGAALG